MAAGKTYVTKGFSTHTNFPAPQHGYEHGPKNLVEPKTINQWASKPAAGFTDFVGSPSKAELLKEYGHAPSMSKTHKYASSAPGYEPNYGLDYENSSPPKYHGEDAFKKAQNQSSPIQGYPSEEARRIHSGPGLGGARHVLTGNISGSNKSWQGAGPTATCHRLTNPTNDINEALGFLEESVYYSPRADPRRRGVLDDLSTREQPIEPLRRYARPAFVAKRNDPHLNSGNTGSAINSNETMRRYRGTLIP